MNITIICTISKLGEGRKASNLTRFKVPSSICYHLRVIPLSYVYRNLLHLLYNISWSLFQYYFLFQENPKGNIFSTNGNKGFQLALISSNELNIDYLIKWQDVVFIMTSLNKFWWILTHCGNLSWLVVIHSHSRVTRVLLETVLQYPKNNKTHKSGSFHWAKRWRETCGSFWVAGGVLLQNLDGDAWHHR